MWLRRLTDWDAGAVLPWQLAAGLLQIDLLDREVAVEVGAWIQEELMSELEAAEMHHSAGGVPWPGPLPKQKRQCSSLSVALMNEEQVRRQARPTFRQCVDPNP